ncbi:MAG TPA: hypothetical protein VG936_05685 [Lacunisphaera sp.]|nr:hypothetical protein [Lacunisphaera sp.]
MKTNFSRLLAALVVGGSLLSPLRAGCEILLYPLARAFGAPPESELVRCRQAFQQLQAHLRESRVPVQPVFCVGGGRAVWRRMTAVALAREASDQTRADLVVPRNGAPAVPPTEFGHNQLRYLWTRAAVYTDWVKANPPAADYVWIAEIFGHGGKVGAIQVYILDAGGQVAYCRLFNSHHFGSNLPLESDAAVQLIVRSFFEDLKKSAEQIFPPYGIG